MQFSITDLHIMLLNIYGFRKNQPSESPIFLIGVSDSTLTHVPRIYVKFLKVTRELVSSVHYAMECTICCLVKCQTTRHVS